MEHALNFDASRPLTPVQPQPEAMDTWAIGQAMLTGVLLEIGSFPKPGLVSVHSCGAHDDMNVITFMVGSASISPAFYQCAQVGLDHDGTPRQLLPLLRRIGQTYEDRLLLATNGVNTQRGALFAGGILCGAAGLAFRQTNAPSADVILSVVRNMCRGLVAEELGGLGPVITGLTHGERLYLEHGLTGIRGEVEAGFPSVAESGLTAFRQALERTTALNDCLVHTLISLMARVDDTTLVRRGGLSALARVKAEAGELLAMGSVFTPSGREAIRRLDRDFIRRGLSPGGSADLLAVTVALHLLEGGVLPPSVM